MAVTSVVMWRCSSGARGRLLLPRARGLMVVELAFRKPIVYRGGPPRIVAPNRSAKDDDDPTISPRPG